MNRGSMYKSDDEDDDDDIGEDLDDLRLACIVSEDANSENEDDFELLRSIKSQLASSTTNVDLSMPSDSEKEEDDFKMLQNIKNQLKEDEDGDAFETLFAIRNRFSKLNDVQGNFMNVSTRKNNQVHAVANVELIFIRGKDSEQEVHEKTTIDKPLMHHPTSSSFPESAQAFVDAIRRNRSYQKFLRKKLTKNEARIEQNEKHKKNVVIVKDFQGSCKRITKQALSQRKDPHVELISTRKKDIISFGVRSTGKSLCVADYKMALEKYSRYSSSLYRRNWTKKENENPAKGLKQQLQETLIREATEQSRQFLPKVNWDQLDIKNRSAAECEARWMSSEDPLVNNNNSTTWTKAEEDCLRLTTRNKSCTDWLDIAEKDKLHDAVDLFGENNWQSVANALQGRTGKQCSDNRNRKQCKRRWERLNPHLLLLIRKEDTMGNFVDRESERPDLDTDDFLALAEISLEQEEPRIVVAPKKKSKARRRKGSERSSGDACRQEDENVCENEANNGEEVRCLEWENEFQDYVKEKKQSRKRKNVAETLSNNSSVIKKLKPRRKVSAEVPIENQDPSLML
ncbi:unnamed protein product [Arabis nemorensis]|uniref:Myb-like domain-containing protein n=1 Tax=Arabis nemorensis TaxID=586526 RepID=A0A565CFQ3_9BRAS|nr:unnamed protein product [Arabis nemorensis]